MFWTVCIITSAGLQHRPVFLLTTLSCHGCKAAYLLLGYSPISGFISGPISSFISGPISASPHPRCPVQGTHHWKSKRRENFDFAKSLRHNRESINLQVRSVGYSPAGMCSFPVAPFIPSSFIQVELEPTIEVGSAYSFADS